MGGYGYGGMQQPQFQGGWGNAQQSQWGGGYQPQQNFGGFGGSPFGGGQQWNGGGQNWGGGYGYNQPQQQPYFGGMMGYQPEQRRSMQRATVDPESKIAYLQKKQEEINARDGTNYKIDQGEFDAIRNGTPRGQQMSAATQLQGQQQMSGNYGSMMGKFSGGGWR